MTLICLVLWVFSLTWLQAKQALKDGVGSCLMLYHIFISILKREPHQGVLPQMQPHSQALPAKEGESPIHFITCVMSGQIQGRHELCVGTYKSLPTQIGASDQGKTCVQVAMMSRCMKTAGYSSCKLQTRLVQQILSVSDTAPDRLYGKKFHNLLCVVSQCHC